jgi:hypothetical protein
MVLPIQQANTSFRRCEVSNARWFNLVSVQVTPWGAGLCGRANVANAYCQANEQPAISISGRKGTSLLSGEDVEISYVACHLGFGIVVFPELTNRSLRLIKCAKESARYPRGRIS